MGGQVQITMSAVCISVLLMVQFFVVYVQGQVDISYEITEESSPRTFGNLVRDLSLELASDVTYRFLSEPDINVTVAADTSDLSITGRIDRDSICPGQEQCSRALDVVISSGDTLKHKKKLEINIRDLNDNAPTFSPSFYVLSIPESAGIGRSFSGLPTAVDNDSPMYGIQGIDGYSVKDNTGTFKLEVEDQGGYVLYLVLNKPLDREERDSLSINVIATDGYGLSGNLTVKVEVKDSNDHAPEFVKSNYEISVKENLPIGTTILTVQATDKDIGPNAEIHYFFRPTTLNEYGSIFGINNRTGDIFLKGTIDYEENSVYILTVVAQDQGSDSIPVDTRVTLNVLDQNDCRPEIQINTLSTSNTETADVVEELNPGAFVAQLLVTDNDSGDNGKVSCTINDNVFQLEEIVINSEYNIITATKLDREVYDAYNLAIICTDQGTEPLTSIKQLRVQVSDVNDHKPEFEKAFYSTEVSENNDMGTSLLTVFARDQDTGQNSDITYELSPQVVTQIKIEPVSGLITATTSLDREAEPGGQIKFYVIAKDKGETPLSSSVQVVITLRDINDEAPYFDKPVYSFHVSEESSPATIGSVHAVDPDSLANSMVSYNLVDSESTVFAISSSSGELRTLMSLDREVQSEYTLVVSATDSGNPPQSSTAFVTVVVDDINDNKPVFVFPQDKNNTVHISNHLSQGTVFAQVVAVDSDSGLNGQVSYSLVHTAHSELFSIDQMTGRVKITSDLSKVSFAEYDLTVMANDHGNEKKESIELLKIIVNSSLSQRDQTTVMLSKPNEKAVIAVACVAAVIIIALVIGIACIYRHKQSLRSTKKKKYMKALTLLTAEQNQRDMEKPKPSVATGYQLHPDAGVGLGNTDNSTQRSSSVQDSGFDSSCIMNRSWTSLNAFHMQVRVESTHA